MEHIIQRNGWYFYDRRIPSRFAEYDNRKRVRLSLDTKCPKIAKKRVLPVNDNIERYWETLCRKKETHNKEKFKELVKTARDLGYSYIPAFKMPDFPIEEIISRLITANQFIHKENLTKAVVGSSDSREIPLSEALELFWDYSKPQIANKDPNQQRKWKNPKTKAIKNLINLIGDKSITALTNKDMVKLRDAWLERVNKEGIRVSSANKDFIHIKGIIETVAAHEEIDIETEKLFKKIRLKGDNESKRKAFSDEFIKNDILNAECLKYLDDETRNMLYASIETGARPIELLNLDGTNDIKLECDIPHIYIRPRKGYSLKTKQSKRKIPLIGKALEAFKKHPNGFEGFRGRPDQFSDYINSFLSVNGLRPTPNHTYYSFRHSFQDRLTANEVSDRIQCQLMGHSFKSKGRVSYGDGASLEHLQKIMKETSLTTGS